MRTANTARCRRALGKHYLSAQAQQHFYNYNNNRPHATFPNDQAFFENTQKPIAATSPPEKDTRPRRSNAPINKWLRAASRAIKPAATTPILPYNRHPPKKMAREFPENARARLVNQDSARAVLFTIASARFRVDGARNGLNIFGLDDCARFIRQWQACAREDFPPRLGIISGFAEGEGRGVERAREYLFGEMRADEGFTCEPVCGLGI